MCGIVGYAGLEIAPQTLKRMCDILVHRGPDEDGYYQGAGVGLAMRRLAIIDLKGGRQPIANETEDLWVVLNGEIYNYQDLRAALIARGHVLKTTSDTETIVHLYEEHGEGFLDHLRGMFGIALWDDRRRRLILARDRIGEKPLFYALLGGGIVFASEIKGLLQVVKQRTVDPQAVCEYFALGYVPGSRTFFKEIRKLAPGQTLVWSRAGITLKTYWALDIQHDRVITLPQAERELEELLLDAVRLCLKSDVEVGAFLSGGLDSSLLTALMRRHNARVQSFSVGYGGRAAGFNELKYARQVASHLGTEHHELILDAHSSVELLPKIVWHYDEPHAEPTSVLVYLLCEFVRKSLKVAVGGTGGDELFFGYPRHKALRYQGYYNRIPACLRKGLIRPIVERLGVSTTGSRVVKRAKRFVGSADLPIEEAYLSWVSLMDRGMRASLLSEDTRRLAEDPLGETYLSSRLLGRRDLELLDRVALVDLEGYLPEYQLAYMDRMSMATSLEVRSPFCDYRLAEYVTALPPHLRLRGETSKFLLKKVAAKYLPASIVNRRKVGFDSPIGEWMKGELRGFLAEFLSSENVRETGLLNPDGVQRLINEHQAGARDHSLQLWSVLAVEMWYRMYIESACSTFEDVQRPGAIRGMK